MSEDKSTLRALSEMRNVAEDKTLGSWTESQRAIVGSWAHWLSIPAPIVVTPVAPVPAKTKGKFWRAVDDLFKIVLLSATVLFLVSGIIAFRDISRPTSQIDLVEGENVDCYGQKYYGLSCIPRQRESLPKDKMPKPAKSWSM